MKHFNQILCPVDFSPNSYHAIEQASFLAQQQQADLTLVHVIHNTLPESLGVVRGDDLSSQQMVAEATEQARNLLRSAKQRYVPYSVTCKSSIRYGDIAHGILQEAAERNAGLIFMACEGQNGSSLQGGVTRQVVERADCPVLTYHHAGERIGFRRILVPVDPSNGVAAHSLFLSELFSLMGPQVLLLGMLAPGASTESRQALLAHLARETALLIEQGISDVKPEIITAEDPAAGIRDFAQAHDCHLIMMQGIPVPDAPRASNPSLTGTLMQSLRRPILTFRSLSGGPATAATG